MFEISYSEDAVTFVNAKTNKAEKISLFDSMQDIDAIRVVNGEIKARENVSKASVSLLANLLNNPRLDGYKGTCPINEQIPTELKQAIRDIETEYLKPVFCKPLEEKGNKPGMIETQWQAFAKGLREGGSYANTKSRVMAYFSHCGMLPKTDNGKLLTVAAIDKLLQNAKEQAGDKPANEGIAGKLVKLSVDIENRTETTELGDNVTAIAALKSMLATYEGLYREELERITALKGNPAITEQANAAMAKASTIDKAFSHLVTEESLTTDWNAGKIDDASFVEAMRLIGIDVELTTS